MEISNKDKKLLVYLLAVIIIAGAYFFGAKPLLDKYAVLNEETMALQTQVNHYSQIYNARENYEAKIVEYEGQYQQKLNMFFSGIDQERTIVMLRDIEKETNIWISRIAFQESQILVGGAGDSTEAVEAETTEETAPAEGTAIDSSITGLKQDLSIDFTASYPDFKRFLEKVKNNEQRLYISSINAVYSAESGKVTCNITLSQFALEGNGIEKVAPDLSGVGLGVDNIFTSNGTPDMVVGTLEDENANNETSVEESAETSNSDDTNANAESENNEENPAANEPSKPQGEGGGII